MPRHVQLMLVGQNVQEKQMEKHIFYNMCYFMKEARYHRLMDLSLSDKILKKIEIGKISP